MQEKILIIEDDKVICEELVTFLGTAGYDAYAPDLDNDIIKIIKEHKPDLILLDINLPNQDGLSLCRLVRSFSQVPIIFITAKDTAMDEYGGLMMGGDDYITKPYNLPVLLARVGALLKRTSTVEKQCLTYKGITLNPISATTEYKGSAMELSKTELRIMYYLFQNIDKVVPRIELIEFLWDNQIHIDDNTLSVHIARLREKLAQIGISDFIQTKRGMGYKI